MDTKKYCTAKPGMYRVIAVLSDGDTFLKGDFSQKKAFAVAKRRERGEYARVVYDDQGKEVFPEKKKG